MRLDVLVLADPRDPALHRCLAGLAGQATPPRRVGVLRLGLGPVAGAPLPVETLEPTTVARWFDGDGDGEDPVAVLVLRESDRPDPSLLSSLAAHLATTGPAGPTGSGGGLQVAVADPAGGRPVLPARWDGAADLARTLADAGPTVDALAAVLARRPPGPVVDLGLSAIAPLGEAQTPPLDPSWRDGFPTPPGVTVVAVGGAVPAGTGAVATVTAAAWTVEDLRTALADVSSPVVAFLDAAASSGVVEAVFAAKATTVLAWRAAAVLVAADHPGPRWERRPVTVGERLAVIGFVAATDAVGRLLAGPADPADQAAVPGPRSAEELVASVLAHAAGRGGWSAHAFTVDGTAPLRIAVPPAVTPPASAGAGPAARPATAWHPRTVVPLELVADPRHGGVLAGGSAPWRPGEGLARVVIGGVESLSFPGSRPLCRHDHGDGSAPVYDAGPGGALLGHVLEVQLVDTTSLYHRVRVGVAALEAAGVRAAPPSLAPPIDAGQVFRAPSPLADELPAPRWPTVLVDLDGRTVVAGHPDVLPAAARAGVPARWGPTLARTPGVDRVRVDGVLGPAGYALVGPAAAGARDVAALGVGGAMTWRGGPLTDDVLLVRWRTATGERLTTGAVPTRPGGRGFEPDPTAELVGTLGWLRPPGRGAVDLVELRHPDGRHRYRTEAVAVDGFTVAGILGALEAVPTAVHVPLHRSADEAGGDRLHLAAGEGSGEVVRVDGWIRLAVPPAPTERAEGPVPLDARPDAPPPTTPPGPGRLPLVRMVDAAGHERVSADPWTLVAAGWRAVEVVGHGEPEGGNEVAALAELLPSEPEAGGVQERARALLHTGGDRARSLLERGRRR